MNTIPEPAELFEAECNALGFYGLPEALPRPVDACASTGRKNDAPDKAIPADPDPAD